MTDTPLSDKPVALDGRFKSLQPCRYCGWCEGSICAGVGPHVAMVRCVACSRFLSWLSRRDFLALTGGV